MREEFLQLISIYYNQSVLDDIYFVGSVGKSYWKSLMK